MKKIYHIIILIILIATSSINCKCAGKLPTASEKENKPARFRY
jgi:hypothetical protein